MAKSKAIALQDSKKSITPCSTRRGIDVFEDNPFVTGFEIQVRNDTKIIAGDLSITDKVNDEVNAGVIGMVKQVDTEQFIKLYSSTISLIFELDNYARRVLIAVLLAVQDQSKDKAEIFLSHNKAVKYYADNNLTPPDSSYFSKGIIRLIKAGFIAKHYNGDGWYWINPNLIFNGDRVRFVSEYRIKRKTEQASLFDMKTKGIAD